MQTYKVRFRSENQITEAFVVAANEKKAIKAFSVKYPSISNEEILDVSESSKEESAKASKPPSGLATNANRADTGKQKVDRYEAGRRIATFMSFLGWLGVVFSLILTIVAFSVENPSSEHVVTWSSFIAAYVASSLFLVGIAHVMRAIFDIADNSFDADNR